MSWDLFGWALEEGKKAIWGEQYINQQKSVSKSGQRTQETQQKKDHNTNIVQNQAVSPQQYGGQTQTSNSGSGIASMDAAAMDALGANGTGTGTGSSGGATSPLLSGDMTFEELIGEICNGIDLCFIVKRSTVVVTDYESLYAEAKYLRDNHHSAVASEDIKLWQLEEGTYELDVAEYGFYNTVIVNYKDGTVTESYEDLVRVYGEVPITYDDKTVDKTTAIMKAKAYLAAHVRDFDMSVKATLLHDAEIDIGDIVTLENPMTMRDAYRQETEKRDPEYFFVMGNSIEWDGEGPIINDIELRYGAKSPDKKEVPETGASYSNSSSGSTGNVQQALQQVGQQWHHIGYSSACQTAACVKQTNQGDCWGASDLIACELESKGVKTRILQYATSYAGNHRSVQYKDTDGTWKDFPYREYGFNTLFNNTSGTAGGTEVSKTCG